jgi:hypothetical protein
VNLVDANVLLHAANDDHPQHEACRGWLDRSLSAGGPVAFTWSVLLAFLRLATKPGVFPDPWPVDEAVALVRAWMEHPGSVLLEPTARHLDVLAGLLAIVGTGGNLTTDAHLAALALEHHATIVTYDNDFGRFPGVRWLTPAG